MDDCSGLNLRPGLLGGLLFGLLTGLLVGLLVGLLLLRALLLTLIVRMLVGILWFFAIRDKIGFSLPVADIVLYYRLADKLDSSLLSCTVFRVD